MTPPETGPGRTSRARTRPGATASEAAAVSPGSAPHRASSSTVGACQGDTAGGEEYGEGLRVRRAEGDGAAEPVDPATGGAVQRPPQAGAQQRRVNKKDLGVCGLLRTIRP